MTDEILRTGGCLCGKSRYQTRGDSPRAIMCHCRYCQTYTGSAFGTQVWFPEDKVTLQSGELSEYENNTESGNVVTSNFCKNCGSTIFLRLNVFQILTEEEALRDIFGEEYVEYQKKVRRWI